ncbi:hypothetical protein [Saccharomonospora piscinae]|uniref:hypothetical protein n=1 Tax=Saccharomonospora piscinae TaxID=687388 RepID=UPI000566EBAA|nr:hypothetical protein [Saccharomonospora piscinae]
MRLRRSTLVLASTTVLLGACSASSTGPPDSSGMTANSLTSETAPSRDAPRDRGPLDTADLQGRWWTWAASSEDDSNPVADPDGSRCAEDQPTDVWFLAGSFGERVTRTCTMPAAVPVAFPVVNYIGDAESCDVFLSSARGSAVLDDRELEPQRHEATIVTVNAVEGNPVTGSGGRFQTHACGLWVQLEPLAPGNHELRIRGASGSLEIAVDYELQVTGT